MFLVSTLLANYKDNVSPLPPDPGSHTLLNSNRKPSYGVNICLITFPQGKQKHETTKIHLDDVQKISPNEN